MLPFSYVRKFHDDTEQLSIESFNFTSFLFEKFIFFQAQLENNQQK
jgi:hypothetical protein